MQFLISNQFASRKPPRERHVTTPAETISPVR